ncbi:MAG: hypothetical protein M3R71_00510 [Actinomycetota bacterium]|nr:hypothetical protein [Actinomycetota bacterium]
MFFLVPKVTVFLILFFAIGLAWRLWRRRDIHQRSSVAVRLSRRLGRATARRRP